MEVWLRKGLLQNRQSVIVKPEFISDGFLLNLKESLSQDIRDFEISLVKDHWQHHLDKLVIDVGTAGNSEKDNVLDEVRAVVVKGWKDARSPEVSEQTKQEMNSIIKSLFEEYTDKINNILAQNETLTHPERSLPEGRLEGKAVSYQDGTLTGYRVIRNSTIRFVIEPYQTSLSSGLSITIKVNRELRYSCMIDRNQLSELPGKVADALAKLREECTSAAWSEHESSF